MATGAPHGEAAAYYQQPPPAPQNGYDSNGQKEYPQYGAPPPPQYGQNYGPPNGADPNYAYSEKPTFDQAFKVDARKWNDLWAGILVIGPRPPRSTS